MSEPYGSTADAQSATSVSQKHILFSEILSTTSVMRKNARWATSASSFVGRDSALASSLGLRVSAPSPSTHTAVRGSREKDLMAGFQVLKRTVGESDDVSSIPLSITLAPFFAIIRSPLSTGPITSAALSSLHNLFVCGYVSAGSIDLDAALGELSSTVSNCKFEASDSAGDEAVMLKIMTVIEDCMCGSVGSLLGDVEVCEMLETVLTTCCQMRLSEILRRSAESTMHSIVRVMFSRLRTLDPSIEEEKLQRVKMSVVPDVPSPTDGSLDDLSEKLSEKLGETTTAVSASEANERPASREYKRAPEYGLPAVVELLRVLVNILDPNDKLHTDSTRLVSMRILNSALEVCGSRIGDFSSLASLVSDHGCKFLFQLARSDNPSVAQLALRTIATIFETMRKQLKLQQELFLAFTIDRLAVPQSLPAPSFALGVRGGRSASRAPLNASPRVGFGDGKFPSAPESPAPIKATVLPAKGETRELLLDTLTQLSSHPSFMVDLYMNYDCDINCEDLYGRLVEFLSQGVYPSPLAGAMEPQLQNAQYLCLDMLLTFVNHMTVRAEDRAQEWPSQYTTPDQLSLSKSRKNLVTIGASLFNTKPKSGVAFLEEHKLIYADLSSEVSRPLSLARFLKSCTRLDKRQLGDYISKPDNLDLLKAFIGLFGFHDKPVAEAMRELLEAFRLPGEAQQIGRITETFAEIYFAAKPDEIKSQDAVYVLAYSIILLNTDLHNPQIRKRMTIEDYRRNLRGVNDGTDFSATFLQNIYDSIRKREIVMPQEHTGQVGFEYAWKELLARSRQTGELMMCNTAYFDIDMFKAVWTPVISATAYAFMSFDDDYIIERAITGFRQCATLAGHFQLPDVFDYVVVTLSQTTSLLSEDLPSLVPIYPVVDVDGHSITVSSLSVKFGTNVKGQLAAVVLFNIVNGNGNALREGWTQIFEMFQNLFLHSLLPIRMLQMEDFLGGVSMIPLRGSQPARSAPRQEGGLLSALSSYLMTPYGASTDTLVPDATDSDVENTLSTIDCIAACRLDELYAQIIQLDAEALVAAVRAIEALAHERTVARLRQEPSEVSAIQSHAAHAEASIRPQAYDPASMFLLETMVSIACQTPQHIDDLWPIILEHLSALLSTPTQYSILLIERAVVALLRLCRILAKEPKLRDQVYVSFDILARLPPKVSSSVAEQVIHGLLSIVQEHREIIRSQTEWNVVFSVLRLTIAHPEAATIAFDMVTRLVTDPSEDLVNADNYQGITTVLDDFASFAGTAVEAQRQQRRRESPLTSATSPVIARGLKAIDLLYELKKFMTRFMTNVTSSSEQAWRQFCLPLLTSLARQSSSTSREVRHASMIQLQRIIMGLQMGSTPEYQPRIEELFNRVLFPLLDDLLKPQTFQRDPQGMSETRLRASALLCKTFMHFEMREALAQSDIRVLWIQILDLLDRLMNIDKQDQLYEAVPESLKNVLLVMNAANVLVPPSTDDTRDERQRSLWAATQERIDRFLPGFLTEVIPTPEPQLATETTTETAPTTL